MFEYCRSLARTRSYRACPRSSTSVPYSGYPGVILIPTAFALSAMTWIEVIQSDHPFGQTILR